MDMDVIVPESRTESNLEFTARIDIDQECKNLSINVDKIEDAEEQGEKPVANACSQSEHARLEQEVNELLTESQIEDAKAMTPSPDLMDPRRP